uniref:LTD domain-containing protein n=1 Tax=Picocystis salinarum TaxID=88271 RepID=A0A7S3UDE1_9CHLO
MPMAGVWIAAVLAVATNLQVGTAENATRRIDSSRTPAGPGGETPSGDCKFPLQFDGQTYSDCVVFDDEEWCRNEAGFWGVCAPVEYELPPEDEQPQGPITINEILPASGEDTFIEIMNVGENEVDLSGWRITNQNTGPGSGLVIGSPAGGPACLDSSYTRLAPGATMLMRKGEDCSFNFDLNKNGAVHIFRANGNEVDVHEWTADDLEDGLALARLPDGLGYFYARAPTPGAANDLSTAIGTDSELELSDCCGKFLDSPNECDCAAFGVRINEFMASNSESLRDEDGDFSDWIEIFSPVNVDLSGWALTDRVDDPFMWVFPEGATIRRNGYLVLFASNKDRTTVGRPMHTNFALRKAGEYFALVRPDGTIATEFSPMFPMQYLDVSFGLPEDSDTRGYLRAITPGGVNSEERIDLGPSIWNMTRNPQQPFEEAAVTVEAIVRPLEGTQIQDVFLHYRLDFGPEKRVRMTDVSEEPTVSASSEEQSDRMQGLGPSDRLYSGTIREDTERNQMIRWYVTAVDGRNGTSRYPTFETENEPEYHGTVVQDPSLDNSIPSLDMFVEDEEAAATQEGTYGSIMYNGKFYDRVFINRRGQTSLLWPKPKLKLDFKGRIFDWMEGEDKVGSINLESHYMEPGTNTYMRPNIGSAYFEDVGIPAPVIFHVSLRQNGEFYGLFSLGERINEPFFDRVGLSFKNSNMYKAEHTSFANLRPLDEIPHHLRYAFKKENNQEEDDWTDLYELTDALAGPDTDAFLYDHLNIPAVLNEMAAQTLILNHDRCSKNYFLYHDFATQEWQRLPWDFEQLLGVGVHLGGDESDTSVTFGYCLLSCEAFNSPFFCDRNHPQDPAESVQLLNDPSIGGAGGGVAPSPSQGAGSAPSTQEPPPEEREAEEEEEEEQEGEDADTAVEEEEEEEEVDPADCPSGILRFFQPGCARRRMSRRLLQDQSSEADFEYNPEDHWNHLTDAIFSVPQLRRMYLRRLRTLMDEYLAQPSWIEQEIRSFRDKIFQIAELDAQRWSPLYPTQTIREGMQQMLGPGGILESRRTQLFDTYGLKTNWTIIPDAQPEAVNVCFVAAVKEGPELQQYVQLRNEGGYAVDVSGFSLDGPLSFTFKPGTVIPPNGDIFVSPDVKAFRARRVSPKAGEKRLVVGPFEGNLEQEGKLVLSDVSGSQVAALSQGTCT